MEGFSHLSVPIAELREGMVLNQDLTHTVGLRQGRVLTTIDIKRIRELRPVPILQVVISHTLRSQMNIQVSDDESRRLGNEQGKAALKSIQIEHYREVLGETDTRKALEDKTLDVTLRSLVEKKKSVIRGEENITAYQAYKNANIDKYINSVKTAQTTAPKDTINIIEHYAQSHADMESLSSVDALDTKKIVVRSDSYEVDTEHFLDAVLNKKSVHTAFVENLVVDFLADMGYELARGMLVFLSRNESKRAFISSHSLQVMIISLVTAIELTRMINKKSECLDSGDLSTFLSISKKTFTLEELVNLGIAALLHDVEFRKQVPDLKADSVFSMQQQSIIDLHTSNGYHIAKMLNIDFEVQRAVFQHHERYDGSGYPSGLHPRFFTKYTPILIFAEHYTESVTKNPFFDRVLSPRDTVVRLLSAERAKFDGDITYAFLKAASLFPVGGWVLLSDNRIGLVRAVNSEKLDKPTVGVYFDQTFNKISPEEINLSKSAIEIVKPLSWDIVRNAVKGPIDFIYH
ncbi:MAG: HD domain-containing protein [Brevinematales bacterium]|nr:HD domain-containing protein [Brevinematales bacterium]